VARCVPLSLALASQSFVASFAPDRKLGTLIPDSAKDGLDFKPTHKKAKEALEWMGFEARKSIFEVLDEAIAAKAEVRVIAYDFNMPEILTRLEKLGKRLKIIIDDSSAKGGGHKAKDSPESVAEKRLRKSAGVGNVKRQHMANLQHHKSIAVSGNTPWTAPRCRRPTSLARFICDALGHCHRPSSWRPGKA